MPWTAKQIKSAAIAARAAGWNDDQRRMVLSGPAFNNRAIHHGKATSKSPRLNQEDFEQFMYQAEGACGGTLPGYAPAHWRGKLDDPTQRLRFKARQVADALEADARSRGGRFSLEGWVRQRIARGATGSLDALTVGQLRTLITQLTKFAEQRGIDATTKTRRSA